MWNAEYPTIHMSPLFQSSIPRVESDPGLIANDSVDRERFGRGICHVVPCSRKADPACSRTCRNGSVVAQVADRNVGAALARCTVPQLRKSLSIGEGPRQLPPRDCDRTCIANRDSSLESSWPLICDGVADVASGTACRCQGLRTGLS